MRKASVFPLPVLAAPRMSLFLRASGMPRDWMSVRVVKCEAWTPVAVGWESGRLAKLSISVDLGSYKRSLCSVCVAPEDRQRVLMKTYQIVDPLLEGLQTLVISLALLLADLRFPLLR